MLFQTQDTPIKCMNCNPDIKKTAKIMCTTIQAYYEHLNPQSVQMVKHRCLSMEINNECNEHSKENINTSNQETPKKYIRCPECGEAILMVPTLNEMIASIENHIISHKTHPHADLKVPHLKAPAIQTRLSPASHTTSLRHHESPLRNLQFGFKDNSLKIQKQAT